MTARCNIVLLFNVALSKQSVEKYKNAQAKTVGGVARPLDVILSKKKKITRGGLSFSPLEFETACTNKAL